VIEIKQIQKTTDEFRKLPIIEREKTVFDIGTRGHFENPTTDVLAFFCNGTEQHSMDNLVADSMVTLLNRFPKTEIPTSQSPVSPQRAAFTDNNKRIELLLSTDSYLIVIEAKVGHYQLNPFDEYESYADKLAAEQGNEAFYVVLSPQG
jgi:hypothetical protein